MGVQWCTVCWIHRESSCQWIEAEYPQRAQWEIASSQGWRSLAAMRRRRRAQHDPRSAVRANSASGTKRAAHAKLARTSIGTSEAPGSISMYGLRSSTGA